MSTSSTRVASSQDVTLPDIPELYNPNFLDVLLPPSTEPVPVIVDSTPAPGNPMIDALDSTLHQTLTENYAAAYNSTLSATLDAFLASVSQTGDALAGHLAKSWAEDAPLTLRLIWNLRSIHDGKGEKEAFYRSFGWLYENHPRTAIKNLPVLVEPVCTRPNSDYGLAHGYWKDLLNICSLAALDELHLQRAPFLHHHKMRRPGNEKVVKKAEMDDVALDKAKTAARAARADAAVKHHAVLVDKLNQPKFRALYIATVRLFTERIMQDLKLLEQHDGLPLGPDRIAIAKQISLAAKWAPTPHAAHDRHINVSTAIALLLHHNRADVPPAFPSGLSLPLDNVQTHTLRSWYQRWVLTPLRKVTFIPEPLMSANQWNEIKYTRVPSKCMKNNTELFIKHDPTRFEEFLVAVEGGKKKISGATLLPHELVAQAMQVSTKTNTGLAKKLEGLQAARMKLVETQLRVVDAQWKALVDRLRESGQIENSIAICDVSGSMGSINSKFNKDNVSPIFPAVSMSLLLAQLAKPPFNDQFITFSSVPQYIKVDPTKSLADQVKSMVQSPWEMNTDLDAVFLKLLLPLAINNQVKPEDMIKRLFIFSDMQFDQGRSKAQPGDWQTNHDVYVHAFEEAGYKLPEIVYWNLSTYATMPVTSETKGVAMMNGFSPAMLKVFMGEVEEGESWEDVSKDGDTKMVEEESALNPIDTMKKALSKSSFDKLVVLD